MLAVELHIFTNVVENLRIPRSAWIAGMADNTAHLDETLIETIDRILERRPDATIILFSDHGGRISREEGRVPPNLLAAGTQATRVGSLMTPGRIESSALWTGETFAAAAFHGDDRDRLRGPRAVRAAYSCASCDFDTYVAAAHRLVAGESLYGAFQAEPYLLIEAARGGGYVYPPTAAVLMAWVGITPELVWRLVDLCSLLVVAVLLVRRGGLLAQLGAAAIVVLAPPTAFAWANGNVTPLLAAGFGFCSLLYPRTAWVIASVGGAAKLFPLRAVHLGPARAGVARRGVGGAGPPSCSCLSH